MSEPVDDPEITTESTVEKPDAVERARVEEILKIAHTQFNTAEAATDHFRNQAIDDTKFRAGTWGKRTFQWPSQIQDARIAANRACITVNRMPSFVRLVTNQARQANLRISVNPVDDNADPKVAEVLQGIIRNIEQQSFADRAYNKASDKQGEIGLGIFRLLTEWAEPSNDQSMRQRIRIRRVSNPLRVYVDPRCEEPDWSDAEFVFYVTDLDKTAYQELTGRSGDEVPNTAQLEAFEGPGDMSGDWFPNGKIRIAEYFHREAVGPRTRIAELSNGDVVPYPSGDEMKALKDKAVAIVRSRYVQKKQMVWRKIDGCNVLEESIWPADSQPFFPVMGEELEVDGERDYRGVVRDAKGIAQVYNVQVTALMEQVGLGTKASVVGYRGQFGKVGDPLRTAWDNANTKPTTFLEVEPIEIDGKPAPLPEPVTWEPPISGTIAAIKQSDEDLKSTAGFRDASLAERGPQESGRAIKLRQDQDLLGSSHYLDNLRYALCAAGRQLIQLIRTVYDAPQVVRIMGKDERPRKVMVFAGDDKDPRNPEFLHTHPGPEPLTLGEGENQQVIPPGATIPYQLPDGVQEIYDIGVGEFDIEVSATPNHGTRRQEDLDTITEVMKGLPPEIATKFLDLYFMLIDSPVARQMHERAKKMFPPPEDQQGGQNQQELASQFQSLQGQFQEVTAAFHQAQQELQSERDKLEAQMQMKREELQSREKIANETGKFGLAEKMLDHKGDMNVLQLEQRFDAIMAHLDRLHERMGDASGQAHATAMAGDDRAAAAAAAAAPDATGAEPSPVQQLVPAPTPDAAAGPPAGVPGA